MCDGRVSLRKFAALVKHLPIEAATAVTQGASGFTMLELLVMETGVAGPLNPRHPWNEAERKRENDRTRALRERRAYYDAQRVAQSVTPTPAGQGESESGDGAEQADAVRRDGQVGPEGNGAADQVGDQGE